MNPTLALVLIIAVSILGLAGFAALAYRSIRDKGDEWLTTTYHLDLDIPAQAPTLGGGSPVEAQLLTWAMTPTEQAWEQKRLATPFQPRLPQPRPRTYYCPDCVQERWIEQGKADWHFPAGVPVLCHIHSPTQVHVRVQSGQHGQHNGRTA